MKPVLGRDTHMHPETGQRCELIYLPGGGFRLKLIADPPRMVISDFSQMGSVAWVSLIPDPEVEVLEAPMQVPDAE